jgi:ubiquinone/menaquinone biosynthesis C-methylase UbiE
MSSPTIWSSGRYEAVAERIAPIAAEVVEAIERCLPLSDATLVDLACGTGSAALAAAGRGARVTAVDITEELIAIGSHKADAAGRSITWVTADASNTGLPGGFDAVTSNMGIIFVEPTRQVAELARLLKSGGVLGFSAWVHDAGNPFFSPIVAVLGQPPATEYSPDQWGDPEIISTRLAADFDDVEIEQGLHTWQFESLDVGVHFLSHESPVHVDILNRVDATQRDLLVAAFETALAEYVDDGGGVSYQAPYVVVAARRR